MSKEIKEYNMNGTLILGIDHGYGNIKTAHRVFPTSLIESDKPPVFSKDYLEYQGKYYLLGEGQKGFVAEKQSDEDNYIFTLAAIGKELELRQLSTARVHLAVGLPLKWVQVQREGFRQYLTQNKEVSFKYRGKTYRVEIADCTVMPQCYSTVAERLKEFTGMNLLVDIGNGTMNIMYLNNGKAMESKSWTEKLGIFQCVQKIRNKVLDETGTKIMDEIINNYLKTGIADVAEPYASLMKEAATSYAEEVMQKLRDYEFNDKLMKLHFMGGGAKIIEAVGTYDSNRTTFNHDICATAKGYEYFCYMKLKHQNKR